MVHLALTLWSSSRLIERTWRMLDPEKIGVEPFCGRENPWDGIVPVTPIMDGQLDEIAISEVLKPLRRAVLSQLSTILASPSRCKEEWFGVYLTCFILLNNHEFQNHHDNKFAKLHGMPVSLLVPLVLESFVDMVFLRGGSQAPVAGTMNLKLVIMLRQLYSHTFTTSVVGP
jgi:hypothetical protein